MKVMAAEIDIFECFCDFGVVFNLNFFVEEFIFFMFFKVKG